MGPSTSRPPLTREAVAAAARDVIVTEGLDAVSFRRLAQHLGVTAPALYAYVNDKEDLLRTVTRREFLLLVERLRRPEGEDPVESLRRFCHIYVDYATDHPMLYRTMFRFPPWRVGATEEVEFGLPVPPDHFAVPYRAMEEAIESGRFKAQHPLVSLLTLWTTMHGLAEVLLLGMPGPESARRFFADHVIDSAIDALAAQPDGTEPPAPGPGAG
jgi:AcrR family transcriptional regulator